MRDEQGAGRLQSLVWSSFFEHTARERFARRLEQFSGGDTATDMKEAAEFWSIIMGEHADFTAHLLVPEESEHIRKAMRTSDAFRQMHESVPSSKASVEKAVDDLIDFKTRSRRPQSLARLPFRRPVAARTPGSSRHILPASRPALFRV
jgi:hypothetical protein